MHEIDIPRPPNSEQRALRVLLLLGALMIVSSYLYRWVITDRFYDLPHAAIRVPAVADTPSSGATQ